MTEDRRQRTDDRRRMTEDRRQRTDDRRRKTEDRGQMTEDGRQKKQLLIKSFCRGAESVGQWVSGSVGQLVSALIGKRSYESLIMMPRLYPETNEKQHKRFAQHIGSPRRGAPGRRRQ